MNNKEAIRRKKLYFEGLERAITQPMPEASAKEIEAFIEALDDEDYQLVMRLWKEVSAPLSVAIAFIHDNRVLPQYKEQLINDEAEMPFMQLDEIYDTLKTLISPTVGEFLSVLQISSGEKKELLDLIESDDKDGFVALLEKTKCDTMPLARLCSHCMDDVMAGLSMTDEERTLSLDHLVDAKYDDDENERCRETLAELQSFIETDDAEDTPEAEEEFYSNFFDYLEAQLTADLHYYWNYYDLYTLKERNLIESILDKPIAVNLVNQIWDEYKAGFENASFNLPDDYFDWKHKSNTPREHFYMDDALKKKGVETFVAFINWLADKGYIADDNDVKALFAYRLTGRCRPEGKELPVIEWHGKNNKPYELIYIVRNFSDRGDYRKMRLFFQGPEWVKDRDSSYSNSADSEFKRQMAEFYPEACDFRKHYIAKGI
ncbi:MAG: hypothetical protein IJ622_05760 [Bacteroidales bacterium]|nr:hypothetical protein [Bacteroidales bacterium]